jgi:hypothetical protein
MQTTTLRPGLLVSLKTSLQGNVSYNKQTLESEHVGDDGAEKARWETERTIANPKEHERAKEARGKASQIVRSICAKSAFGLLCPESKAEELAAAIADARKIVEEFNESAELTAISLYVITGRVAADDVEAIRAINSEVRDLMTAMSEGVRDLDVTVIRDAANRARQLGSMLSPTAEARMRLAIDSAREAARKIVKAGEQAAREIDIGAIRKITEMRTTFLDLEDVETRTQAPVATGRAVDLVTEA